MDKSYPWMTPVIHGQKLSMDKSLFGQVLTLDRPNLWTIFIHG